MRSFKIYGKWSVQASKHTHARAQCSHASVGLAQARPNNQFMGGVDLANQHLSYYSLVHPAQNQQMVEEGVLVPHMTLQLPILGYFHFNIPDSKIISQTKFRLATVGPVFAGSESKFATSETFTAV